MSKRTIATLAGAALLAALPLAGAAQAEEIAPPLGTVQVLVAGTYSHTYELTEIDCYGAFSGEGQYDGNPGVPFDSTVTGVVNPDGTFSFTGLYEDVWELDGEMVMTDAADFTYTVTGTLAGTTFDDASSEYLGFATAGSITGITFGDPAECDVTSSSTTQVGDRVSWTAPVTTIGGGNSRVTKWTETFESLTTTVTTGDRWNGTAWAPFEDTVNTPGTVAVSCTTNGKKGVNPSSCQQVVPKGQGGVLCPSGQQQLALWAYDGTETFNSTYNSYDWTGSVWTALAGDGTKAWMDAGDGNGGWWASTTPVASVVMMGMYGDVFTKSFADTTSGLISINDLTRRPNGLTFVAYCGQA